MQADACFLHINYKDTQTQPARRSEPMDCCLNASDVRTSYQMPRPTPFHADIDSDFLADDWASRSISNPFWRLVLAILSSQWWPNAHAQRPFGSAAFSLQRNKQSDCSTASAAPILGPTSPSNDPLAPKQTPRCLKSQLKTQSGGPRW